MSGKEKPEVGTDYRVIPMRSYDVWRRTEATVYTLHFSGRGGKNMARVRVVDHWHLPVWDIENIEFSWNYFSNLPKPEEERDKEWTLRKVEELAKKRGCKVLRGVVDASHQTLFEEMGYEVGAIPGTKKIEVYKKVGELGISEKPALTHPSIDHPFRMADL